MRKRYLLVGILAILTLAGVCGIRYADARRAVLQIDARKTPYIDVRTGQGSSAVRPWGGDNDSRSWFFLPSCVQSHKIAVGDLAGCSVWMDGRRLQEGAVFTWEEGAGYRMQIVGPEEEVQTYELSFMKSENIPAIFIDTASGSMAYLHENKENEETGEIRVVREDGNTEYQGRLERISTRGNSTFVYSKKPYGIKLSEKYPLCGMDKGDKWKLLALCREGSKMDNKIALDIAEQLGIAYHIQGTWTDLYLNGEYAGIYLLTESVSVGDGRIEITDLEKENKRYCDDIDQAQTYQEEDNKGYLIDDEGDITGGYLIEKDYPGHYEAENCGFTTSAGDQFTVQEPAHASARQIQYIQSFVEDIDRMVQNHDDNVWEYLDMESLGKRYLTDEISLNTDAGLTSLFFYKERGDDTLYTGPAWDYDNAFGERNSDAESGYDYDDSVRNICLQEDIRLKWYAQLYDDARFRQYVAGVYEELLPYLEELLDAGIDRYAQQIRASVGMDAVRWQEMYGAEQGAGGKFADFDANVKYTKYFIARRLNKLCAEWGVAHEEFVPPSSGEMHTVTFANRDGVVDVIEVMDGAEFDYLPEYDASAYQGWTYRYNDEKVRRQIPVYDDILIYNSRWM